MQYFLAVCAHEGDPLCKIINHIPAIKISYLLLLTSCCISQFVSLFKQAAGEFCQNKACGAKTKGEIKGI